ncbi:hypothetical protein B7463_g2238, partial [Scytalidium lignicola]
MEAPKQTIPKLQLQSPAVDFIDNHLAKYHPAFANHHARYDHTTGRNVAIQETIVMPSGGPIAPPALLAVADDYEIPPRPLPSPVKAMKFWDDIFLDAMSTFEDMSTKDPTEPIYSIRGKKDWETVYGRLEAARNAYNSTEGIRGKVRNVYRKVADNIQPVIELTKFVPDIDYVTPVLSAVQVLLEAAKQAGKTRRQILGGFDELDLIFAEVELFLETFPKDENIRKSSIRLVAIIFKAIELVICFFTNKNLGRRIVSAISKGEDYQLEIINSIDDIQKSSQNLITDAEFSQMVATSTAIKEVLKRTGQWKDACQVIIGQLNNIQNVAIDGFNSLKDLLQVYERRRQDDLARWMEEMARRDEQMRKVRDEYAAKERANEREIAHLKGAIRSISPMPRAASPYLPPLLPPVALWSISRQELWAILNIGRLEEDDLAFVDGRRARLPSDERARAEQIVQCHEFKEWILFPTSIKLLVHGNFKDRHYVSALSLFCSSLYRNLQEASPRFVPLIFFCSRHVSPGDGGRTMIKSLIAQLLWLRPFDTSPLRQDDVASIQQGDLYQLCNLFWWLVRQLPAEATVFCLIDGIGFYEREEFIEGMEPVLSNILVQMADNTISTAIKVLITNPSSTRVVREAFDEEWILSMEAMVQPGSVDSRRRLDRRLQEGLSK